MIMIIFIIILSLFFLPPLLPVRFPGSQAPLSRCLAARWPEVTQVGGGVGSSARSSWSHGNLPFLCYPTCPLAGPHEDGQGDRDLLRWLRCFGAGGRGAWRLKRYLGLVDGGELPPSSPGICLLQAPLGALVLSWLSHLLGTGCF